MEAISRASASEPDCARYQIFGTLPSDAVARSSRESAADPDDAASIAEALEATRAACMSHLEPHVEGYIWQKDPFQLEVVAATPRGRPAAARPRTSPASRASGTTSRTRGSSCGCSAS